MAVHYCDGAIETNQNGITTVHTEAVTTPDGEVFLSSQATLPAEHLFYHENVHVNDRKNTQAFLDYENILCDNLELNSEKFHDICAQINEEHYGGKYDIESVENAKQFIGEIAAYVNEFVMTDPAYADELFSGMFSDWEAVKAAAEQFNQETGADFSESASFMPENPDLQSTAKKAAGAAEENDGSTFTEPDLTDLSQRAPVVRLAHALGYKILFNAGLKTENGTPARGSIDRASKTITLNPKANKPIEWILRHEITHGIENTKSYQKMLAKLEDSDLFKNWLIGKTKLPEETSLTRLKERYREMVRNGRAGEDVSFGEASGETVADFVADTLFSGDSARIGEFLNRLGGERKGFIEWIQDLFKKIKNAFTKDGRRLNEIDRLEKAFLKAADESIKNPTEDGGVSYSFGVTQEDIDEYVAKAKKQENTEDYKKYADVSEKLIEDVKDDIDLSGYVHALRDNDIRHIFNSHGENTNEKYPVTERDIESIPYIVENYDKVFYKNHKGNNSLIYVKVFKNGMVYYVEQATNKYGNENLLVNKQMIKTGENDIPSAYKAVIAKKEGTAKFLADLEKIRREYAQSVVGNSFVDSIPSFTENVKENSGADENIKYSTDTEQDAETEKPTFERVFEQYESGEISREEFRERMEQEWAKRGEEHGTIPEGENATEDYMVPQAVKEDGKLTRRYVRTILESGKLTKNMEEKLGTKVLLGDFSYEPGSNEKNIEFANNAIQAGEGEARWNAALHSPMIDAKTVAIGEQLLADAAKTKDDARVLELSAQLADVFTRGGQLVQAARLLKKMTGVGRLVTMQRFVNTLNENNQTIHGGDFPLIEISEGLATELANAKTQDDIDHVVKEIEQDIANQSPVSWLDKWNAWRYMSMLANPLTHVRNLVGNALFVPVVRVSGAISAGIEAAFVKQGKRTKSFLISKEYLDFAKSDRKDDAVRANLGSDQKYNENLSYAVKEKQQIFQTKALERVRTTTSDLLETEDMIFKNIHYQRALAGYLQARKINLKNISEKTLNAAREYAAEKAKKYTFNDASSVADYLRKISQIEKNDSAAVKAFKFGMEGILPFKRTPVNIIRRGMEYSPIGLIKTLTLGSIQVKRGKITLSQFIDGLGAGLTGTAVFALGMLLRAAGVVTGGFDDDRDDLFSRLNGEQEYAIQIFGKSYTIDWAVPACLPFFIGVETMNSFEQYDAVRLSNITEPLWNSLEPITNLSMLSGLQNTLSAAKYSKPSETISAIAEDIALSYSMQGVPSVLGAVARTVDPTQRKRYTDRTSKIDSFGQEIINNLESKIPGVSYLQSASVDEWGRIKTRGSTAERIAENFLSPGKISTYEYDDINAELKKLAKNTGEKRVYPKSPPKKITIGHQIKYLTAKEYEKYSILKGQYSFDYIQELVNSPQYKKLSDDRKVNVIDKLYQFANAKAKTEISDYEMPNSLSTVARIEKNGGSVVDYYLKKELAK